MGFLVPIAYHLSPVFASTHLPIHSFPILRKVTSKHEDYQGFCFDGSSIWAAIEHDESALPKGGNYLTNLFAADKSG